nr:hypothetical protein [Actinomadura sp. WMMB 499]
MASGVPETTVVVGPLTAAMCSSSFQQGSSSIWFSGRATEAMAPGGGVLGEGLAAFGDDRGGILEGEGSGGVGGGDLALGVADDGVGVDAVGLPERGQPGHHREQGGLDDVGALKRGGVGVAAQEREQ